MKKFSCIPHLFFFLLLLFSNGVFSQNITTIAGTGTAGYNGDGIAATSAQLNYPQGLAVDAQGNIFIADILNQRIRKITIGTGIITTIAGTGTAGYNGDGILATTAQLFQPTSISFDENGDLYFTDRSNNRVRKINMTTGIITTIAGTGTGSYNGDGITATSAQLNFPNEVSLDKSGNIYIADWLNHRVRKIDKVTGLISTIAGTGTQGYNGDGIPATSAQISGPCGIIFDVYGNTYFAEYPGCRVRKIAVGTGLVSTIAGTGTGGYNGDGIPATTAQLWGPAYIRFDCAGNLFIGDGENNRVRKVNMTTGLISTISGTGTGGYNGDGIPANTAQLYTPYDVFFDKLNCDMYIGDERNHRIRKITGGFSGCPAPVAPGNLVNCQVLPTVNINAVNNNVWVPVYDSSGKIALMINANGNNLGVVNTSLFTKTGACREDGSHRLYLNRNLTITPQSPPSTPVSIRLYVLKAELDSLKTALNSQGQPSGVASINEVDVFKNSDACAVTGTLNALPLTAVTGAYNTDYYLQVSVNGFSSFYFANKLLPAILPVTISDFNGRRGENGNRLSWKAGSDVSTRFTVERSEDGSRFIEIGSVNGIAGGSNTGFQFTDLRPLPGVNYYRLKIISDNQFIGYSSILVLKQDHGNDLQLSGPNSFLPGTDIRMDLNTPYSGLVEILLVDPSGRVMHRSLVNAKSGSNKIRIRTENLARGIYFLMAGSNSQSSNPIKLLIQ